MTIEEYIAAVKKCPRVEWAERGLILSTKKPTVKIVAGYLVQQIVMKRSEVVPDWVFDDPIKLKVLAKRSNRWRQYGPQILGNDEIRYLEVPAPR